MPLQFPFIVTAGPWTKYVGVLTGRTIIQTVSADLDAFPVTNLWAYATEPF